MTLNELVDKYLSEKFDVSLVLTELYVDDFEKAIEYFNFYRQNQNNKFYFAYLRNAAELNNIFGQDLPGFEETIGSLLDNEELAGRVFGHLRDSTYFKEVWEIRPIEHLHINLLLLIYRTTILQSNKDILIDQNGQNRVQISSTIEEMVACMQYEGLENKLFPAFEIWYRKWKEEDFDERLYLLLKEGGGIIGAR